MSHAEKGLLDADLGGGVIKQRVARPGEGKSGGYRSIILFRSGERAVFAYGFAKSDQDNIGKDELKGFRELAGEILEYDDAAIDKAIKGGALEEVKDDEQEEK